MAIKYWGKTTPDYSAMRWPCPEGFHVMRTQDFTWLKTIMESLSLTISDWSAKLKIPLSWDYGAWWSRYWLWERRGFKACDNVNQYWAYIYWSKYPGWASTSRKSAHPIRPFKDKYETPTSSRTVIEWTLWSAWIFRDETNWLISITDWTNWYTITDKNLWATVVFNSGDSESANNVWNYYQWGNNYWFSYWRSESKSSSQVDASQYWPWNYYSDNTFRTWANPAYWDSSINTNLRWWETGVQQRPAPIKKRYYGWKIIKDIQWPAPYGFHVPSNDEWAALCSTLATTFSMARLAETMGIYLKIPMAWERSYSNANVSNVGSYGYYWSFTPRNAFLAYALRISPSNIEPTYNGGRASGESLRCFKDSPTIPTSSWTTLYDGSSVATGAWVFYNATDGLISVSWDWQTWYTIMDKNLWATTVYNYWDTLTDANCGYFYQWGNNYWFPHSWTVTTSSTQVDASNYWPWNYYSSNIFITYAWRWDTTDNRNLWWWITRWQHLAEVIKVYKWNTLIQEKS